MIITEICAELRNWFVVPNGVHIQTYTISGGSIAPLDFLQEGQYFRIIGSVFNDGVHQYPAADLTDEVFHGAVWAMSLPPDLIALSAEIQNYIEQNPASGFSSESFGGYSYTRATASDGSVATWRDVFRKDLNRYRKL